MREICLKCYRGKKACLCHLITPFTTQTKFCFLMHPKEAKKEKVGTGRATHLFLKNSHLFIGVDFNQHAGLKKLLEDPAHTPVILYPGKESLNLSAYPVSNILQRERKLLVIILDGTWPCAKKIMRESSVLHGLPRISFNFDQASRFIIKQQPSSLCLSTIESVQRLLSILEQQKIEPRLLEVKKMGDYLDALVQFQVDCANDPSKSSYRSKKYSALEERKFSKRWEKRSIFFT